jgi:hypothetical protein
VSRIEILTADALRGELERAAIWLDKKGDTVAPPLNVVRDILTLQTRPRATAPGAPCALDPLRPLE